MARFSWRHIIVAVLFGALVATALPAAASNHVRKWTKEEIDQMKMDVAAAKAAAESARDNAVELATNARDRFAKVSGDMRARIDEAIDDAERTLAEQVEGRDEFLGNDCGAGSPCDEFRNDLLALLDELETVQAELADAAFLTSSLDFSRLRSTLNDVPGRVLYPIYRVLVEEFDLFESGHRQALRDMAEDLPVLRAAIETPAANTATDRPANPTTCVSILNDAKFEMRARRVMAGSGALKLHAKGLIAAGETTAGGNLGGDGYIQLTLKNSRLKSIGNLYDGAADFGLAVASWANAKFRYCLLLDGQHDISDTQEVNQTELLAGQTDLAAGQEDLASVVDETDRRDIERLVSECTVLTSLIVPLPTHAEPPVYGVVDDAIASWGSEGFDVATAQRLSTQASLLFRESDFIGAYQKLCDAYDQLVG